MMLNRRFVRKGISEKKCSERYVGRLVLALLMLWSALAVLQTGLSGVHSAAAEVYAAHPPSDFRPLLHWTVFDVDEGDAMLLECGGESLLVDGGPWGFRDMLRKRLAEAGCLHLTYVFSTHYHDDHIDGIFDLFSNGFTAEKYMHGYSRKAIRNDFRGSRTVGAAEKAGIQTVRVTHGERFQLGSAQAEVYQCTAVNNTNARSLMLRISVKETSLLLCADVTGEAQHWFVEHLAPEKLRADVVKLPHHGITPTVKAFLDTVEPSAAVITNRKNRAGEATLGQLTYRKLPVWFSGEGTVHGVTDGIDWYIWQEGNRP